MQSLSVLLSLLLTPNYGRGMFRSVAKRLVIEHTEGHHTLEEMVSHTGDSYIPVIMRWSSYSWENSQPYWGGGSTFLPRDSHIPGEMGPPGPHSPGNMGTRGPHFTVSLFSHDTGIVIKVW